jgi:CBS domain-containing protein/nucleotide-binding universal stress UspA family protein
MGFFQSILAPTDQSPQASRAVAAATRLAIDCHAELTVLIAVQAAVPPAEANNIWGSGEDTEEKLRKELAAVVRQQSGSDELHVDFRVLWEEPARSILSTANSIHCDLIVIGARGAGGAKNVGHVATAVAAGASCPVMIISEGSAPDGVLEEPQGSAVTVRQLMRAPAIAISSTDTLARAQSLMREAGVHQLPVVDADALVAIVSRRDIEPHASYLERTKVDAVMTHGPVTVTSTDPATRAANLLVEQNVNSLPVVDDGRLVGIISKTDLLRYMTELLGHTR